MTLKIGALTKLGLFFLVVCFIYVFDQTLAEHLYRDKGLYQHSFESSFVHESLHSLSLKDAYLTSPADKIFFSFYF